MADRFHHGDLRRALMDATLTAVAKEGTEAFSLRGAARRLGVTHASAYRHFKDKASLFAAIAEEGFAELAGTVRAVQAQTPLDALHAIGRAYVQFALANEARYRIMFGPALAQKRSHRQLQAAARESLVLLVDVITACQRARQVRKGNPIELALTAWSLVHGMAQLALDGQLADAGLTAQRIQHLITVATEVLRTGLMS